MLQDICHPILRLRHQNIWFHPPYKLLKFCYLRLLRSYRVRSMYWCKNKNMGCKFSRAHIETSKYIISVCSRPLHCTKVKFFSWTWTKVFIDDLGLIFSDIRAQNAFPNNILVILTLELRFQSMISSKTKIWKNWHIALSCQKNNWFPRPNG